MKYFLAFGTLAIVIFWLVMNGLLVRRELEIRELDHYQRGVSEFLGSDRRRERWMSIYRQSTEEYTKVGYTGFTIEKTYNERGGEYQAAIDTCYHGSLPFQGWFAERAAGSRSLKLRGHLALDLEMKPLRLKLDIHVDFTGTEFRRRESIRVDGERDGDSFLITLSYPGGKLDIPLPLRSLALSDGFSPALPLAGYEVGETYRVQVFNPLTPLGFGDDSATVRVVDRLTEEVHGTTADVFELETVWRGMKTRSWVTSTGEVVRQTLGPPLNLTLHHERTRESAVKGCPP